MEGLENLSINDLKFDSENDVFDVFKSNSGGTTDNVSIDDPTKEKKETASEEPAIEHPESVASVKESQGKDGKTASESSNSSSPQQSENSKMFSALAAELKSQGVLPNLDLNETKIESLDDLNKAVQAEVDARLDGRHKAVEKAMSLGLDVQTTAQQYDTIQKLKAIPEDAILNEANVDFRRDVLIQDFVNKGYAAERAQAMAQRTIDAGTDIEEAKIALQDIIAHEEKSYTSKIHAAETKEKNDLKDIKQILDADREILPGVKLTQEQRENIYNQIVTDLGNRENAFIKAQKEDPINSRVKLEALFHLTNGLTDFSMFGKAATKKVNNNFEELLRGSKFAEEGGGGNPPGDENATFTLNDLKNLEFLG